MEKYNVVILAGGRCPWLKEAAGTDVRCLAKINGKRMLDYIVEAIRESGRVKRILLAISADAIVGEELPAGVELCEAAQDLPSTADKAVAKLNYNGKVLFVCDDIPMLHGAAINDFLDKCEARPGGNSYYPLIPKEVCEAAFPQAKRTYAKIKEGCFTGGNIMMMDAEVIPAALAKGQEIFAKRKKPAELVRMLGIGFILKFLFRCLSLDDIEKRGSLVVGFEGRAVISSYAEIGMDIDKPADLEVAQKYLG
ncbi:MAG: NTP transferase domain-containing protein [Phascolarctobacterium sp.]|nr:NTP transferase domain-containing protein [Phascolarctobacterium sp.]